MDPSGSELDSSLPQPETPCLIVEDSQPDSIALEDDPESSYRALLTKRLSNLQPHSPSPVLEVISSPPRERLSQKESQNGGNHNNHSHEPDQSLEALENSPVLDVIPSGDNKMADMEDMESGADSTTCAQPEAEGMSQFGMLELSESQGFHDEPHKSEDVKKTVGRNTQSQDFRRSEVSSSSKDSQRLSIQALLHSQAAEEEDMVSSQEDLFQEEEEEEEEEGRVGTRVDSTVSELGKHSLPTCTPAGSLHLLHLSGQGTLVQESLSQQSVDYVAATQERMSQTPLIVPNSPTGDEPMDISRAGGSQSQRGDGRPKGSSPLHKPRPTSTPVSQNSPSFVLDKSLSLPSQPEFSHDPFIATPSLSQPTERGAGPSSSQAQSLPPAAVKSPTSRSSLMSSSQNSLTAAPGSNKDAASPKHLSPTAASQSKQQGAPPASSPSQVGNSFQLELSSTSQPSIYFQKTQSFLMEEDEDSQATQIENVGGGEAAGTDVSDGGPVRVPVAASTAAASSQSNVSGGGPSPSANRGGRILHSSQPGPTQPASQNVNVGRSLSQGSPQVPSAKPLVVGGSRAENVAVVCSPQRQSVPVVVPSSLPSQSLSQSMLSAHSSTRYAPASQISMSQAANSQPLALSQSQQTQRSQPLSQRSLGVAPLSQGRASQGSLLVVEETQKSQKGESLVESSSKGLGGSSGLRLALSQSASQSQKFDTAEPMEQEEDLDQVETQLLVPGSQHTTRGVASSPAGPLSPQRSQSQRESQQKLQLQQREKGVSASQPSPGLSSPERRREMMMMEKSLSPGKGSLSQPERGSRADPGARRSQSQGLSDSSGDIPFHFTLPKEGELIRPVVTATPPLISQLKKTPRHSTPIEMTSFSGVSEGDLTRGTTLADSDIVAEESMEEVAVAASAPAGAATASSAATATAEASGKLSLRMKLVTPVEEASSGSEHFSLQKPPLSDDDGPVGKATAVAKAVSSPSVFSRVREAHRQEPVEEEVGQPSAPSAALSVGLLNSPSRLGGASQDSDGSPCPLMTSTQSSTHNTHLSQTLSPTSQGGPLGKGTPRKHSQQANGTATSSYAQSASQQATDVSSKGGTPGPSSREGGAEATLPRTPARQRAVSQQTSLDVPVSTSSTPSKRAVSQQTSFDGVQNASGRGEPELSPRPPPGVRMRRHVRTIQEVRTTVTRIITDVYYEDGREVDRKVTEESEEPVVDCRVLDSDLSPSRTGSSMTSGDLADVSSLSSKASSLGHSSSGTVAGTSTSGPGRHPDFLKPTGRGAAKAGRRGRKQPQSPVSERSKVQAARPLTPVTPRGRPRRGRPPSRSPQSRGGRGGGAHATRPTAASSSQEEEEEEEEERFTRVNPKAGAGATTSPSAGPSTSSQARAPGSGSASDSSLVGLRVVAKWSSNGYFYSGRITSDLGSGRFRLLFDDGYECEVQGRDVLLCDPIPTDTEVTAISDDDFFCTGVVKGHKTVGGELQYCVEREGQQQWYSRASVILSMEQGILLREQHGLDPYEPLTPLTKAADISLDNLVDGKRRRRSNVTANSTPTRSSAASSPARTPGPSGKRKLISSAEDERQERTPAKRGRKAGPNKAGARSAAFNTTSESDGAQAGAGTGVCNTSGSGTDLPSDSGDLLSSHGPLPTSDSLFMGFAFLLTASSFNDRLSNLATSDEDEDCLQTAPYNKHYITSQLEAGGGLVLPDFNEEQCKAAYQSLLIADQHCRTRKFLLCVASGVPCVSNAWVRDCCQEQKLLNYRNYLLPAGMGPGQRVIEWHPRCSPFKSLRVLLVFGGAAELWGELLKLSGAASVKQVKGGADTDIPANTYDVMVTEKSCPSAVIKLASSASLPVVSLEWLVQSLIIGERQDYKSDPQYSHDYTL